MKDFGLVMAFKDQSSSFSSGFVCGQIWEMMKAGKKFDRFMFSAGNREQIEIMCNRFLYSYSIDEVDNRWCYLTAEITN